MTKRGARGVVSGLVWFALAVPMTACADADCAKILAPEALNAASSTPLRLNDNDTRRSPTSCSYSMGAWGGMPDAEVTVQPGSPHEIDVAEGYATYTPRPIPGIGDEAHLFNLGSVLKLRVKRGPYTVSLTAASDRISEEKLLALARTKALRLGVVDRLPRKP